MGDYSRAGQADAKHGDFDGDCPERESPNRIAKPARNVESTI
jgi:hypothetical protein